MEDWVYSLIVCIVAVGLLTVVSVGRGVRDLVWAALVAHLLAALAQVYVTVSYYGSGDMVGYFVVGRALGQLMQLDPETYVPEVLAYLMQQRGSLPVGQAFEGTSTASMTGLATFVVLLTGGSLWSACLFVAAAAFFSKVAVCRVLWERLGAEHHRRVGMAILLLPSSVFWSAGLLKESVAICGVGALIAGAYGVHRGRLGAGLLLASFGAALVGLVKAYLLFPLGCAMSVWAYFVVAQGRRPDHRVVVRLRVVLPAAVLAILVVVGLGAVFPEYAIDRFAEEAAAYQEVGTWRPGGSSFELGDPRESSVQAQLAFVPLGLFNVFFRPLIFEASNALLVVSAAETSMILVVLLGVVFRRGVRVAFARVLSHPELAFCAVLTFVMGVGIGLTTSNLGTLSRYRAPMMPFFAVLLLVLAARQRASGRARGAVVFPGPSRALMDQATAGRRQQERGA